MSESNPGIGLLIELDRPQETAALIRYQLGRLKEQSPHKTAELDQQTASIRETFTRQYAERAVMAAFHRSDEFERRVQRLLVNLPVIEDCLLKAAGAWEPDGAGTEAARHEGTEGRQS